MVCRLISRMPADGRVATRQRTHQASCKSSSFTDPSFPSLWYLLLLSIHELLVLSRGHYSLLVLPLRGLRNRRFKAPPQLFQTVFLFRTNFVRPFTPTVSP